MAQWLQKFFKFCDIGTCCIKKQLTLQQTKQKLSPQVLYNTATKTLIKRSHMKHLITALIAFVSLLMVSCSANDEMFEYSQNRQDEEQWDNTYETKAIANFSDSAYIRIGMYNAIAGYDVKVENIWIETTADVPALGKNIEKAGNLPNTKKQVTYDQEGGRYNNVIPTFKGSEITVHFDVAMNGTNGVGGRLNLTDATYTIAADLTTWDEGCYFDYVIAITPEVLNLNPVVFSAIIEDWQE